MVQARVVCFLRGLLVISFFLSFSLYLIILFFLLRVDSDAPRSSKAHAAIEKERGYPRERVIFLVLILSHRGFLCMFSYVSDPLQGVL